MREFELVLRFKCENEVDAAKLMTPEIYELLNQHARKVDPMAIVYVQEVTTKKGE